MRPATLVLSLILNGALTGCDVLGFEKEQAGRDIIGTVTVDGDTLRAGAVLAHLALLCTDSVSSQAVEETAAVSTRGEYRLRMTAGAPRLYCLGLSVSVAGDTIPAGWYPDVEFAVRSLPPLTIHINTPR